MQLTQSPGSIQIHRKKFMRSLFIDYPRLDKESLVFAVLLSLNSSGQKFNLPVVETNAMGVEIRLPSLLSGMFCLELKDGEQTFRKTIALQ